MNVCIYVCNMYVCMNVIYFKTPYVINKRYETFVAYLVLYSSWEVEVKSKKVQVCTHTQKCRLICILYFSFNLALKCKDVNKIYTCMYVHIQCNMTSEYLFS